MTARFNWIQGVSFIAHQTHGCKALNKFLVVNAVTYSNVQYSNTLQVGHFLTRFAHASQSTECPQGLNVTIVFVLQTKHSTDASAWG